MRIKVLLRIIVLMNIKVSMRIKVSSRIKVSLILNCNSKPVDEYFYAEFLISLSIIEN